MQEPSRQLLRHFTGRLAQAELLELRPEFAIANSGQDKGILVILLERIPGRHSPSTPGSYCEWCRNMGKIVPPPRATGLLLD